MPNTNQTIQDIYQKVVSPLSLSDLAKRGTSWSGKAWHSVISLRLAALILNDITEKNIEVIDSSDTWTEQDRLDITSFSLKYGANLFPSS